MSSGIWTATSGAISQANRLDTVSNNLANSETPAFKRDQASFREYLSVLERDALAGDIPRGPIKDKDFYPLDGKDQSFVLNDGTYTDFKQGNLRVTHRALDLALDGPGFFEVLTPAGIRYTRTGALRLNNTQALVSSQGFPILGVEESHKDVSKRILKSKDPSQVLTINELGEVFSGDEKLGRISIVEFKESKDLRKEGGELYSSKKNSEWANAEKTFIRQGVLEVSNVNPIHEMTEMIKSNRLFEQDLKAMKTFGEMMSKESNEVGKL